MSLPVIVPDWPAPAAVRAAATTRAGGVSTGAWASLNLGDHVGDDPAAVAGNRARLCAALQLPQEPLWLRQVHGVSVADAVADGRGVEADAMIADRPGQACVVLTADCLPILLCDEAGTHVAAVHAGWRGLAAGVLEASVDALGRIAHDTADAVAVIGPHIGARCYEVDAPVVSALTLRFGDAVDAALRATRPGHCEIELARLAALDLSRAGFASERIAVVEDACTACDPVRFHSYRRDGPASGRLFHYIAVTDDGRQSS